MGVLMCCTLGIWCIVHRKCNMPFEYDGQLVCGIGKEYCNIGVPYTKVWASFIAIIYWKATYS